MHSPDGCCGSKARRADGQLSFLKHCSHAHLPENQSQTRLHIMILRRLWLLKWTLATIVPQLARKIIPKSKSYSELT
jgi:hypothetical protein